MNGQSPSAELRFAPVTRFSELREGRGRKVILGDQEIALWRVGAAVYAISNVCAHQHFSRLHEGTREGLTVRCPMHGWRYSLQTGEAVEGNGRVRVFPVKIQNDIVLVGLAPDEGL
ncbi:MAG TPA: Rieske 2Fe-2S domain-containing protein [Bacteroidota bacterium]